MIILVSNVIKVFNKLPIKRGKRIALIPNAKDKKKNPSFKKYFSLFKKKEHNIEIIDLRKYKNEKLYNKLLGFEIIFVAGGNCFSLLEIIRKSGFDKILDKLLQKGIIYLGESAGACIMGASIEPIKPMDNPDLANLDNFKGLEYFDYVFVPHYKSLKYNLAIKNIEKKYSDRFKLRKFTDSEGLIIEGDSVKGL